MCDRRSAVGFWLRGEYTHVPSVIAVGRKLIEWLPKAKARRHPPAAAKGLKRIRPTASASKNEPRRKRKHRVSAVDDRTEIYQAGDESDLVELVEEGRRSHIRINRASSTKPVGSHPPTRSKFPVHANNSARSNRVVISRAPSGSSSASASTSSASGFVYYTL